MKIDKFTLQDELFPELSLYTLQPDTPITKDMDHDTVLATDVVSLLTESQVGLLTESPFNTPQYLWEVRI